MLRRFDVRVLLVVILMASSLAIIPAVYNTNHMSAALRMLVIESEQQFVGMLARQVQDTLLSKQLDLRFIAHATPIRQYAATDDTASELDAVQRYLVDYLHIHAESLNGVETLTTDLPHIAEFVLQHPAGAYTDEAGSRLFHFTQIRLAGHGDNLWVLMTIRPLQQLLQPTYATQDTSVMLTLLALAIISGLAGVAARSCGVPYGHKGGVASATDSPLIFG